MRWLGVGRSPRFSPNSVARDAAVLHGVAERLRRMGDDVELTSEDDYCGPEGADGLFCMARDRAVLALIAAEEERGLPVVNSARALLRATRTELTRLFAAGGIPQPDFVLIDPSLGDGPALSVPWWLKRGDACAQEKGDVTLLRDEADVRPALRAFARRGIASAVGLRHVPGDLVKFYGVEGSDFFYYYYPTAGSHFSKFGLERANGAPGGYVFDVAALKRTADRAARLSGLTVYGGDCIVRPAGDFCLIDFNDWPSFSLCKDEAAAAIARKLFNTGRQTAGREQ